MNNALIIFACLVAVAVAQYAPQQWGQYGGYWRQAPIDHIGGWYGRDGAYERSANYAGWRQGWGGYGGYGWAGHNRYHGPIHLPLIKKDGNLVNTPDVAELRRRHQERLAINAARSSGHGYGLGWDGYGQDGGVYIPIGYGPYGRQH